MTGATGDLWKRWNKHFYLARNTKECAEMMINISFWHIPFIFRDETYRFRTISCKRKKASE
jgi:hypothetical protein